MAVSRRDMIQGAALAGAAAAAGVTLPENASAAAAPLRWAHEADVVIIGAGATGMPAAIRAREAGASVINLIEAEADIGGHAICSGANIPLGGGTSYQKRAGIVDSPDLAFQDLVPCLPRSPPEYPGSG